MPEILDLPAALPHYERTLTSIEEGLDDCAQAQSQALNYVAASGYDVAEIRWCIAVAFEYWKHQAAGVAENLEEILGGPDFERGRAENTALFDLWRRVRDARDA